MVTVKKPSGINLGKVKKLVEDNKDFNSLMNEYKQGISEFIKVTYTVLGDMQNYLGNYELHAAAKVGTEYAVIQAREEYSNNAIALMKFIADIKENVQKNPAFFKSNTIEQDFFNAMQASDFQAVSRNDLKVFIHFAQNVTETYQDVKNIEEKNNILNLGLAKLIGHERYVAYESKKIYLADPKWEDIDSILWGAKALDARAKFLQSQLKAASGFLTHENTKTIFQELALMSDDVFLPLKKYQSATKMLKTASEDYIKYGMPLEHIAQFHQQYDALLALDKREPEVKEKTAEEANANNGGFFSNILGTFSNFRWSSSPESAASKTEAHKETEKTQGGWEWSDLGLGSLFSQEAAPEEPKPQETPTADPKQNAVGVADTAAPKDAKVVGKYGLKDKYTQDTVHGGFQKVLDFLVGTAKAECYAHVIKLMQKQSSCVIQHINVPQDQEAACNPFMEKAMMAAEQCEAVFNMASAHDDEIMRFLTESAEVNLEVDENEEKTFATKHDKATLLLNYVYQPQTLMLGSAEGASAGSNLLSAAYADPTNIEEFRCVGGQCDGQALAIGGQ